MQSQQRQREIVQNAKLPGNGMMAGNPAQIAAMRNQMNMQNKMMMNGEMQRQALAKTM